MCIVQLYLCYTLKTDDDFSAFAMLWRVFVNITFQLRYCIYMQDAANIADITAFAWFVWGFLLILHLYMMMTFLLRFCIYTPAVIIIVDIAAFCDVVVGFR